MARTITFQPNQELGGFIEGLVEAGNFQNQSEVVRAGLRLLQEENAKSKLQELRNLIDEAEDSPTVKNWDKKEFLIRMRSKMNVSK